MNERVLYTLLALMAVTVLTVFLLNTQAVDSAKHEQIDNSLREIRRLDALLNQRIITSRYELQHNYDMIDDHMRELATVAKSLRGGPLNEYGATDIAIAASLDALERAVDRKRELIDDFKTDNALVKNSLQHLPHGVAELAEFRDPPTLAEAQSLLRDILTYNLNEDPAIRRAIERRLGVLLAPARSVHIDEQQHIANLARHVQLVLQLQPTLDALLHELLSTPLESVSTTLQHSYFAVYNTRLRISNRYRVALYLLSSLLLLLAMYVFVRLRASSRELAREKERAQVTLHSIGDGVITTDSQGKVDFINPAGQLVTGWTEREASGEPLARVLHLIDEHTLKPLASIAEKCLSDGRSVTLAEHTLACRRDGQEFSVETSASPIRDRHNNIVGTVVVFRDVTKTRSMARELQWHASHDPLTGLANRREFEQRINLALQSARVNDTAHALIYLDLDQFKIVNDTCGHVAGDELLRQITVLLQPAVRNVDTLARLGGDEFGLLLENCPVERAVKIADDMRGTLRDFRFAWKHKVFTIGGSIGIAPITRASRSIDEVLSAADMACYAAKDEGRNRVHVYESTDGDIAQRHGEMQWTTRITHALAENRFRLYAQRVQPVRTDGNTGQHYELLLRLIDETGEIIPPGAFIPAAERYNMMQSIDRWVVSTVCQQIRKTGARGDDTCAINLSGQSISDPQFLAFTMQEIRENGIAPNRLCFEITETAAVASMQNAEKLINTLKGLGCRFSLDDFGMGLSSYAYLKNLPVDYLKIDGTFVKDMHDDLADRELVRSINQIAHVMNIKTIAECVETENVWNIARDMGIDYAQGFYIERPRLWLTPVVIQSAAGR